MCPPEGCPGPNGRKRPGERNSAGILVQANNLLGRVVTLQTGQDTSVSGSVTAVQVEAGTPKIVVNGQAYPLSELLSILPGGLPAA